MGILERDGVMLVVGRKLMLGRYDGAGLGAGDSDGREDGKSVTVGFGEADGRVLGL